MPESQQASLAAVLEDLCRAVGADAGGTLYLDDGDGTLMVAASTGSVVSGLAGFMQRLSRSNDRQDRRALVMPIAGSGGGVAVLRRWTGGEFTQQDRAVARLYARRFSNDGVVGDAVVGRSGWTRQLEAIQRIAARLTRLASVEEVAATICTETREVIDHDEAHVLVLDDAGMLQSVAATGPGNSQDGAVPALPTEGRGTQQIWAAVRGGAPALLPDIDDLGSDRTGSYSMLIVPLHYETRVNGVICLLAKGSRRFDDDDLRLMQILSDQAAVAIENARLLHGRDELVRELAGLLEISEAAGAAEDEERLAELLTARVRQQTGTDAALVARWDEGSTVMRVLCRDGVSGTAEIIDVAESAARRQVLRDGRPVVVQAHGETSLEAAQLRQIGASTLVLVPLNAGGRTIGMIELIAFHEARHPTPVEMQACEAMASLGAAGLEKARVLEQLRSAADMDLVTGVHNHRYLQERLRQEIARSARSHASLAVLMLDLDKFKPVNDRHGHADGDRVLHNVAATIWANVRTSDIVARYGGDEFVVLMPDTPDSSAEQVARRVVSGVSRQHHALTDGTKVTVGVSAGLAIYPTDGRTSAQLLAAADAAMYTAKRGGGRQVGRSKKDALPIDIGEPLTVRATA